MGAMRRPHMLMEGKGELILPNEAQLALTGSGKSQRGEANMGRLTEVYPWRVLRSPWRSTHRLSTARSMNDAAYE